MYKFVFIIHIEIDSTEKAAIVFSYFLEISGKEKSYIFTKSFLTLENLNSLTNPLFCSISYRLILLLHFSEWARSFQYILYTDLARPIEKNCFFAKLLFYLVLNLREVKEF